MPTFQIGSTYSGRFIGDADAVFTIKVLDRTAKTITVDGPQGLARLRVSQGEDGEIVYPFGRFSMAPMCKAKRVVA